MFAKENAPPPTTRMHGYMGQIQELEMTINRCKQKVQSFTEQMIGAKTQGSSSVAQLRGVEHHLEACLLSLSQSIRDLETEIDSMAGL